MGKSISISPKKELLDVVFIMSTAMIITFLLFYIDEGAYNFTWMNNVGNWIPFALYISGIVGGQVFINQLFLKKQNGKHKLLFTALFGVPLGILFTIAFLKGIH
jgi:hypothetical protein